MLKIEVILMNGSTFLVTFVYASTDIVEKRVLWNYLIKFSVNVNVRGWSWETSIQF